LDELIARGDGGLGILVVEERVLFGDFDDCVDDELLERHCILYSGGGGSTIGLKSENPF
jgi:hypothetical protein